MSSQITMQDVSDAAGVSRALVSVVLSGRTSRMKASEATRARILSAASRLGYVVNQNARGLRMSRSFLIGVLTYDVSSSFIPEIQYVKRPQVKEASNTLQIYDSPRPEKTDLGSYLYWRNYYCYSNGHSATFDAMPKMRHGNGLNALFLDGHAVHTSKSALNMDQLKPF